MVAAIPQEWIHLGVEVISLERDGERWLVRTTVSDERFDVVMMAAPAHVARALFEPVDVRSAELMQMEASSAVVVGFGFEDAERVDVSRALVFLCLRDRTASCWRARLWIRSFRIGCLGRAAAACVLRREGGGEMMRCGNDEAAAVARMELARILGPLPEPQVTVVGRWPLSLPQYSVGHLERMAELEERVRRLEGLWLLGNGYRGVGLPDLIRDARAAAQTLAAYTIH